MQRRFAIAHLVCLMCLLMLRPATAQTGSYLDDLPPLIDREVFFGDPEIAGAQLSPNGEFVSFRRPLDGVMNVWVKRRGEAFEDARPLTADMNRPIPGYFWSRDSRYVLFVQDQDGDENYHVYAVDPTAAPAENAQVPDARPLTSGEDVRAIIYSVPRHDPVHIIVGLNDRTPQLHDVYRVNIHTGESELLIQNDENIAGWGVDDHSRVRTAVRQLPDGGTEILRVEEGGDLTQVYTCSNEESCGIIRFHEDGERGYLITNRGDVDLIQLVLFNLQTGQEELVESDPEEQADFSGAIFSEDGRLLATYYVADRQRIYIRDDEFRADYERLQAELPEGDINVRTRTTDNRFWLVGITSDVDPGATYLYDRSSGELTFLYRPRPDLPVEHLAPMEPVRYTARDGLEIPAYLTVPKGVEPRNLPVIILPHGGPWWRDYWGYDAEAQFLANRGYAVLQPNFRGSTGYGKAFLNAGNFEWGTGAMQHDITDGVQWLIEQGIADPDRIGIYGGSYGGYATLAGLAFTPELYAAGVSFVGPSNIITLLNSIPPYWEPIRKMFTVRVGDLDDPEDVERMKRQSPLHSAENIRAPLLVVQGANDPRVKQHESDQIVVALRDLGRPVEYIVAPDEGHGFARKPNRLAFYTAKERFLAEHLGGRYQESMEDELRRRLEEISVDVSTVELHDPTAAGAAVTSELPLASLERIQTGIYNYKVAMSAMGQQFEMDLTRTIEAATLEDRPVFTVVDAMQSPMGAAVDSVYIDQASMRAVKRVVSQAGAHITVNYANDRVTGRIEAQGQQIPIDSELDAPVFPDGGGLDVILSALPLGAEYSATYRIYDVMSMKSRPMSIEVTGSETVESSAGTFETYAVTITPLDGEPGGGKMWVSKDAPHVVVKSEGKLPAQAGGGDVSMELVSLQ